MVEAAEGIAFVTRCQEWLGDASQYQVKWEGVQSWKEVGNRVEKMDDACLMISGSSCETSHEVRREGKG